MIAATATLIDNPSHHPPHRSRGITLPQTLAFELREHCLLHFRVGDPITVRITLYHSSVRLVWRRREHAQQRSRAERPGVEPAFADLTRTWLIDRVVVVRAPAVTISAQDGQIYPIDHKGFPAAYGYYDQDRRLLSPSELIVDDNLPERLRHKLVGSAVSTHVCVVRTKEDPTPNEFGPDAAMRTSFAALGFRRNSCRCSSNGGVRDPGYEASAPRYGLDPQLRWYRPGSVAQGVTGGAGCERET